MKPNEFSELKKIVLYPFPYPFPTEHGKFPHYQRRAIGGFFSLKFSPHTHPIPSILLLLSPIDTIAHYSMHTIACVHMHNYHTHRVTKDTITERNTRLKSE
jgi:hypothetical protein